LSVSHTTVSPPTAVLQRVKTASVTVDGQQISQIGKGLLVLAAIDKNDTEKDVDAMAGKILKAKLWDDEDKEPPARVSHDFVQSRLFITITQ
jgi:D-tyrosyl-tRNA(Tyr) deacylase